MKTLELSSHLEIERLVDALNENGRATISAYWAICQEGDRYIEDLSFPVSRRVKGEVEKKAKRLKETGKIGVIPKGRKIAWDRLSTVVLRDLRKLGFIELEKHGERTLIRPQVGRIILRTGKGSNVTRFEDIVEIHNLIRKLRGTSKTRRRFELRLLSEVQGIAEIIFPVKQND
ncbi:MAG TPA: hypothetical protein VIH27_05185 [Nitrososphaerales archaeon]